MKLKKCFLNFLNLNSYVYTEDEVDIILGTVKTNMVCALDKLLCIENDLYVVAYTWKEILASKHVFFFKKYLSCEVSVPAYAETAIHHIMDEVVARLPFYKHKIVSCESQKNVIAAFIANYTGNEKRCYFLDLNKNQILLTVCIDPYNVVNTNEVSHVYSFCAGMVVKMGDYKFYVYDIDLTIKIDSCVPAKNIKLVESLDVYKIDGGCFPLEDETARFNVSINQQTLLKTFMCLPKAEVKIIKNLFEYGQVGYMCIQTRESEFLMPDLGQVSYEFIKRKKIGNNIYILIFKINIGKNANRKALSVFNLPIKIDNLVIVTGVELEKLDFVMSECISITNIHTLVSPFSIQYMFLGSVIVNNKLTLNRYMFQQKNKLSEINIKREYENSLWIEDKIKISSKPRVLKVSVWYWIIAITLIIVFSSFHYKKS